MNPSCEHPISRIRMQSQKSPGPPGLFHAGDREPTSAPSPASRSGVRACVRSGSTPPRSHQPSPPSQRARRREPCLKAAPRCARPSGVMPPDGRSSVGLAHRHALRFSPYRDLRSGATQRGLSEQGKTGGPRPVPHPGPWLVT